MKIAIDEQNRIMQGNLLRAAARAILGRLTPFKRTPQKSRDFLGCVLWFSLFDNFISIYFYRLQDTVKK